MSSKSSDLIDEEKSTSDSVSGLTPPVNEADETDQTLTPRKRPKLSFWKSNQTVELPCEVSPTCGVVDLKSLRAGSRSKPVEVRVVCKEVRSNYLKITVMDSTGERVVKAFRGCIQQFQDIEVNKIYKVEVFNVQTGYLGDEIILQSFSKIVEIVREGFPEVTFTFKKLNDLISIEDDATIDVIGIITNKEAATVTSKGTPYQEVTITDDSKAEMDVIFWKNDIGLCDNLQLYTPLVLRMVTKKTRGGNPVLWINWKSQIVDNPNHDKVKWLLNWFSKEVALEDIKI